MSEWKTVDDLRQLLESDLLTLYGPMLTGHDLMKVCGFKTMPAFRRAFYDGRIGLKVFTLENRDGQFALAKDVAEWLAHARFKNNDDANKIKRKGGEDG